MACYGRAIGADGPAGIVGAAVGIVGIAMLARFM
jgi:hypothetical protein